MVRTRTLFLDFAKLSQVKGGEVVSILAMVCNDLAVTNSAMSPPRSVDWLRSSDTHRQPR